MPKIKHIALSTQDVEKTARFYIEVFGLKKIGTIDDPGTRGCFLSDGDINLAILNFKNDEAAGAERGRGFSGIHHIGFEVESLEAIFDKLAAAGAERRHDVERALGVGDGHKPNVEVKFRGPDGIMLDVSETGWVGTSSLPGLTFTPLHPHFVGEASPIELRAVHDAETLAAIRAGMDRFAVLVFHDQAFSDAEHLAFAQRLDGALHTKLGSAAIQKNRFGNEALGDISNVGADGEIMQTGDRRRAYSLGNRLWHTDASFQDPPGRYSMLHAKVIPPAGADTEYADMRAAYDALPEATKAQLEGLRVHHSIAYSRQTLGFDFSKDEEEALKGAIHPLVRTLPRSGRRSLYVAAHASRIVDWPVPEGRLLLRDLIEHATQRRFVYRHAWRVGDLVIWDNRATMHRATPFEDTKHRRELRRVTTLDTGGPDMAPPTPQRSERPGPAGSLL